MKILINTPDITKSGGVANHYRGLQNFWSQQVTYNSIGGRKRIPGPIILFYDYMKFFLLCAFKKYDIILLNPSLGNTAIKRDAVFLEIAKWFGIRTIVFFHGWNKGLAQKINENPAGFLAKFQSADAFIVLAKEFKTQLENWGIKEKIFLTTTKVDDSLLDGFDLSKKTYAKTILFLARIEEYKGIFIALRAFKLVLSKYPEATLKVAGDGKGLAKAIQLVENEEIHNVEFLGNISGKKLKKAFLHSSVYILPTYGEGMPTSVLEAMAFGLPILSRPVGGLNDFFEEGKMGYLLESLEPENYASKISYFLEASDKIRAIGAYNYNYSTQNFLASKVALQLEKIMIDVRNS